MRKTTFNKVLNYFIGELDYYKDEGNQKLVNHYLDEINALQERYQYKNAK